MENVFSFKSHLGRRIRVTFLGGMKLGQHIDMVSNFDVLEIYGSYTDFFQRYSIFDINVLASSSLLVRTGPAVQFRAPAPFFHKENQRVARRIGPSAWVFVFWAITGLPPEHTAPPKLSSHYPMHSSKLCRRNDLPLKALRYPDTFFSSDTPMPFDDRFPAAVCYSSVLPDIRTLSS